VRGEHGHEGLDGRRLDGLGGVNPSVRESESEREREGDRNEEEREVL
jgi:hypothetical protein